MRKLSLFAMSVSMLALSFGGAMAQPRPDDRGNPQHFQGGPPPHGGPGFDGGRRDWHRGDRVDRDEWRRGGRIDYRSHHLRRPPRGYEWREVNGAYILGAIATGIVADIILNGR